MAQGYNDRLHESLGAKHPGPHQQSLKSRSHESEAMEKKKYGHKYGSVSTMKYRHPFKDRIIGLFSKKK